MSAICVWLCKLHVDCYNMKFLYTSLPFCLLVCCVWSSLLQWSSISLMWADVRTPDSGNDNMDVAAWWIGRVLGPLWGPSLKDFISHDSIVRTRPSIVICFSSALCLGRVELLLRNLGNVWRTVYLHTPYFVLSEYSCMWRFINLRLSSFWDVIVFNYY